MKKILITGCAGFIGYHLSKKLAENYKVYGIDSLNDYYDLNLKKTRLKNLQDQLAAFDQIDISNKEDLKYYFENNEFDLVVNLAAQAGVRFSLEKPEEYIKSNIDGFYNILENCKEFDVKKLFYASSSSVYGLNEKVPFSEDDRTDKQVSLYAATKKANESLAYSYSSLYGLETVGMRFFTVYGPYGRPDMAYYSFAENILNEKEIVLFNNGELERDFTYIDDITEAIDLLVEKSLTKNLENSIDENKNYFLFNIGNNNPVGLLNFVNLIQRLLGKKAKIKFSGMQKGDVYKTYADIKKLEDEIGYKPIVNIEEGLTRFIEWFKAYKGIN